MSSIDAGLPAHPTDLGSIPIGFVTLGSSGGYNWIKAGELEYLRAGVLKAFEGKYSTFVKRAPWSCFNDVTVDSLTTACTLTGNTNYPNGGVTWDGTYYLAIQLDYAGAPSIKYCATLGGTWNAVTGLSGTNTGSYSFAMMGNILLVAARDATSAACLYYKTAGATALTAVGSIGTGTLAQSVASNAAGTLAVLVAAAGSHSASIWTSTNGTAWTNRTGSGGANFTMSCVHWSPCASAFLVIGPFAGTGIVINKTTDGYTQTASMALDTTVSAGSGADYTPDQYVASNATTTIVSCANGIVFVTKDGATWTKLDLRTLNLPVAIGSAAFRAAYDSVTGRLILWLMNSNQTGPFQGLSSLDGLTWTPLYLFKTAVLTLATCPTVANGKTLMQQWSQGSTSGVIDVTKFIPRTTPDYVGESAVVADRYLRIA